MSSQKNNLGFGTMEGLLLVFILLVLSIVVGMAFWAGKAAARDVQRVADVMQLQEALKLYFGEYGYYPAGGSGIAVGSENNFNRFLLKWPEAPTPVDGSCTATSNNYYYQTTNDASSYELKFCIGGSYKSLNAGLRTATPDGFR